MHFSVFPAKGGINMVRRIITQNDIGKIPTIPIFVGFTEGGRGIPFPAGEIPTVREGIFGNTDSINSYFREISFNQLELGQEPELSIIVDSPPDHYSWGFTPGVDFDPPKAADLISDTFAKVLQNYPTLEFQDKLILIFLNAPFLEINGRGAMPLVPGSVDYPRTKTPRYQELFVGHPPLQGPPFDTSRKEAFFIGWDYNFMQYMNDRSTEFHNNNDHFVRGVCLFCNDTPRSCAVHDVIHIIRRLSPEVPTADFIGSRSRAVPCLYNLIIQGYWTGNHCDRTIYCAPYIGWWDNMGDHLHPRLPRDFFGGEPYGVCAFTKIQMGTIPSSYIGTAAGAQTPFTLARLSVPTLPPQSNGQPVLAVKIPLSGGDPTEYLLVEYRRYYPGTVDGIQVDVCGLVGNCADDPLKVNPPDRLASDKGFLVYHVNEEKTQLGGEPADYRHSTTDAAFVQDFLIYLYTPSMVTETGVLDWTKRTPLALKNAAFKVGPGPGYIPTFRMLYPFENPIQRIEIHMTEINNDTADIEVTRSSV
jgi:hypothetical protein